MWNRLKQFPFFPAILLTAILVRLCTTGLSWAGFVALALGLVWFGYALIQWLPALSGKKMEFHGRQRSQRSATPVNEDDDSQQDNLVSLVYFLSESRTPDEDAIRGCVASALQLTFDDEDLDSEHFVIRFTPPEARDSAIEHYMVRVPGGVFAILVSSMPYIDDPRTFARESVRDKRLRSAIENHTAWLSVDLMEEAAGPEAQEEAYATLGKILASLAGPDCLAIYSPSLQRCNEFDLSLLELLTTGHPLHIFDEPTFEPIIEISDNNPQMIAAVAEAVRRWPEFVEAFHQRAPSQDGKFIAKAEFREGKKCEYMWVSVSEISGNTVSGTLMNDPHELINYHRGVPVEFTLERLNDWIFPIGDTGQHSGGFTLDVLAGDEEE